MSLSLQVENHGTKMVALAAEMEELSNQFGLVEFVRSSDELSSKVERHGTEVAALEAKIERLLCGFMSESDASDKSDGIKGQASGETGSEKSTRADHPFCEDCAEPGYGDRIK